MKNLCFFTNLLLILGSLRYSSSALACGGNYTGQGYFVSPNYPYSYPARAFCRYNIFASAGQVVQLTFKYFSTELGYDFLRCYSTLDPSYASPNAPFSGVASGQKFTGSNTAVCLFNSDSSNEYRGFNITFSSVPPPAGSSVTSGATSTAASPSCGGTLSGSGSLWSPGYPSQYPSNLKCQWRIVPSSGLFTQLQIVNFRTESLWDSLRISCSDNPTSLLAQYSGTMATTRVIFPCSVTLSFTTDGSEQQSGFNITYTSVANSSAVAANATRAGLLLPSSCGVPTVTPIMAGSRIVGGQPATPNSWPWQIMLRRTGQFICGGSLITNWWVVTAAHCVDGNSVQSLSVSLGKHNAATTDSGEVNIAASKAIMYPSYDRQTQLNDIALIKLKSPVTFTRSVSPICLPSAKLEAGSTYYITGWGDTIGNVNLAKVLMQATIPVLDYNTCCQYLPSACYKSMVCAGLLLGGKDTCQGDSGGPMVRLVNGKFELAALTSWGDGCAQPLEPGVYTNVYGFESWILSTMAAN